MSNLEIILARIKSNTGNALFWNGKTYSYSEFWNIIKIWEKTLKEKGVKEQDICAYYGDYSPSSSALVFALMKNKSILVPFTPAADMEIDEYSSIAGVDWIIKFSKDDSFTADRVTAHPVKNDFMRDFYKRNVPGLIVFTSGSTGKPKGILQDCDRVLNKFIELRQARKTLLFLMMDHFGGFNTLMSVFAYGGMAICLPDRKPDTVCELIEKSGAELVPTTPTFLNLLISSNAYKNYDLSSVKMITYGTELMPESTLIKIRRIFPGAIIKQTYGLSELGVLRSQSEDDNSVWIKIGGGGFETKVVNNTLWIRSEANMVGYLNAPNPIDKDGWMDTGDEVEIKGEFMRFLGRKSEIINVGGQKVFPAEVESVLLEDENVAEATITGMPHQITGWIVVATITLNAEEDHNILKERLRKLCLSRLARYKVPVKFIVVSSDQYSARYKKIRKSE